MNRLFAVGDIHGCADELRRLLAAIRLGAGDKIVFLGDYIDRGPDSCGVLEELIALRDDPRIETVFLKGNHEDMFLDFAVKRGRHGAWWLENGGDKTLRSYRRPMATRRRSRPILEEHVQFLLDLPTIHRDGPFLFVHAGVHPDKPLDDQEAELLWVRDAFHDEPHDLGAIVVFGHTPTIFMKDSPPKRGHLAAGLFFDLPYKLGIDSGCVYGGRLSCVELRSGTLYQVEKGASRARIRRGLRDLAAVARIESSPYASEYRVSV